MNERVYELIREHSFYGKFNQFLQAEKIVDTFLHELYYIKGMIELNSVTSSDKKIIEQVDSIIEKYKNVRRNKE